MSSPAGAGLAGSAGTAVATGRGVTHPWRGSHAALRKARLAISRTFRHPLGALAAAATVAVVGAACYDRVAVTSLPTGQDIHQVAAMAQATVLLDAHDQRAFTLYREQRIEVPLKRISPHLVRAIVAMEDQRFYDHDGIDLVRVAGAALNNVRQGSRAQGGSTLTQQLARNSFLTPEKTYTRKIKELVLARRIEAEYSKDQILEMYLNKVYFGAGLYGAEAAALGYFGMPAADLSLAQAALLAGLVKSPSTYAPTVNLARATSRRNLVLWSCATRASSPRPSTRRRCGAGRAGGLAPARRGLRAVLQGGRPPRAGRALRRRARVQRRFEGLHHDRPRDAEGRRRRGGADVEGDRGPAGCPPAEGRTRRGKLSRHTPTLPRCRPRSWRWIRKLAKCGRWWADETLPQSLRPGPPSEAPGRLGVQAVRLCSGDRGRLLPASLITDLDNADHHAPRRVDPEDEHSPRR